MVIKDDSNDKTMRNRREGENSGSSRFCRAAATVISVHSVLAMFLVISGLFFLILAILLKLGKVSLTHFRFSTAYDPVLSRSNYIFQFCTLLNPVLLLNCVSLSAN